MPALDVWHLGASQKTWRESGDVHNIILKGITWKDRKRADGTEKLTRVEGVLAMIRKEKWAWQIMVCEQLITGGEPD